MLWPLADLYDLGFSEAWPAAVASAVSDTLKNSPSPRPALRTRSVAHDVAWFRQQPHKSWTQWIADRLRPPALRPRTILSCYEKQVGVPEKPGKPMIFERGTHLAKKLFCMSGNRLGLTTQRTEPWMAIGGQPERSSQKRETDDGGGTVGTAEG